MIVVAHRGACHQFVENSWQALNAAIAQGCQRIEFDVRFTADHELIVLHDANTRRISPQRIDVTKMTKKQRQSIRLNNGEPIPLLSEVIDNLGPLIELNIEIKSNSFQCADKVLNLVNRRSQGKAIIISTFNPRLFAYLGKHPGHYQLALLWDRQLPSIPTFAKAVTAMEASKANLFHPHYSLVNPRIVDQSHRRGWTVIPYIGLKEEAKRKEKIWQRLQRLNIDGLCTNFPDEFVTWLKDVR